MSNIIKTVDDFNTKKLCYNCTNNGIELYIDCGDNQRKPLTLVLGNTTEHGGVKIKEVPEIVKVNHSGKQWEKEKVQFEVVRDDDIKKLEKLDKIVRMIFTQARPHDKREYFPVLTHKSFDNCFVTKAKIHPTETLVAQATETPINQYQWCHIGGGKPVSTTSADCGSYQKNACKRKGNNTVVESKKKQKSEYSTGYVDMSSIETAFGGTNQTVTSGTIDLSTLGDTTEKKEEMYQLYKGDNVCASVEVGNIWSCDLPKYGPSYGVTLELKHVVVVSNHDTENDQESPVKGTQEVQLPTPEMFA